MGKGPSCLIFICKFLARFTGPAMSRWDGGCDDLVYSAGGGSAARIARRSTINTQLATDLPAALAPSRNPDPLRRDERYGIAEWLKKGRERLTTIRN